MKKIMKSILSLLTTILCILLVSGLNVRAAEEDYKYTINGETATITLYVGQDTDIFIPSTLGGKTVTAIGENSFNERDQLASVIIPEGVTSIEDNAFAYSESLESISFPDSITSIGNNAFEGCRKLDNVTLPEDVTALGESCFASCRGLSNITLPANLTNIGPFAFYRCISLKNIFLPDKVTFLASEAFLDCTSLASIRIPDSVTNMDNCGLGYHEVISKDEDGNPMTSFEKFTLTTIIGGIGSTAQKYAQAEGLNFQEYIPDPPQAAIEPADALPDGAPTVIDNNLYVAGPNRTLYYIRPLSKNIKSIILPSTVDIQGQTYVVTAVYHKAFAKCSKLKVAVLPPTIQIIGKKAFYKCKRLKKVYIQTSLLSKSSIYKGAFSNIHQKATFYVPSAKKKAYKKILRKRGMTDDMKIKGF